MINIYDKKTSGFTFMLVGIAAFIINVVFSLLSRAITGAANRYLAFLLPQLGNIFVIVFICKYYKANPLKTLPFKCGNPICYLLAFGILIGMFLGLGSINDGFINLLRKIGLSVPSVAVPTGNAVYFVLSVIIVALIPAVVEELLFRGIILNGFKFINPYLACVITGALFAIFHGSAAQLIYQFIIGFMLSLLTIKAGSIYPAIIVHFLNNLAVLLFYYFFPQINLFTWYFVLIGLIALGLSLTTLIILKYKKSGYVDNSKFSYGWSGVIYYSAMILLGLIL